VIYENIGDTRICYFNFSFLYNLYVWSINVNFGKHSKKKKNISTTFVLWYVWYAWHMCVFAGDREVMLKILADDRYCGRVIGKEGKVIKKIREDTDTHIVVSKLVLMHHWLISFDYLTDDVVLHGMGIKPRLTRCRFWMSFKFCLGCGLRLQADTLVVVPWRINCWGTLSCFPPLLTGLE